MSDIKRMRAPKSPVVKAALQAIRENKQGLYGVALQPNGIVLVHDRRSGLQTSWYPDGGIHSGVQAMAPQRILTELTTARSRAELLRKYTPRSSSAIGDRQTLTMAASQHPLPGTGPYRPPPGVDPQQTTVLGTGGQAHLGGQVSPGDVEYAQPGDINSLGELMMQLYPISHLPLRFVVGNSQAIGDRPVTTMTNPLPGYRPPTMINTPLARSLATLITQHLARPTRPLVNTPLLGAPTQMGRL